MNYIFAAAVILFFYLIALNFLSAAGKIFISVFTATTIFYGLAGTFYWENYEDSLFLGVDWAPDLVNSIWDYVFIYIIVCFSFVFFGGGGYGLKNIPKISNDRSYSLDIFDKFLFSLVAISSLYTLKVGSGIAESGSAITSDPFVLILYQFSDIGIGLILFCIANDDRKKWILIALLYSAYAFIVGFRYRLLLLWAPILCAWFVIGNASKLKKIILSISASIFVLISFSLMTISRSKFGGVNLDKLENLDVKSLLYGFFADSNILFGWLSAKSTFGVNVAYAGVSPFAEIFIQFIPRFIYPEKNLYKHLWDVNYGLGGTMQALMSGTAMPFFGEYYAAFGWIGVFCGIIFYGYFSSKILIIIEKYSSNNISYIYGVSLVSFYFAYYYFSRGSVSQIFKGAIFIVFIYIFLCAKLRIKLANIR